MLVLPLSAYWANEEIFFYIPHYGRNQENYSNKNISEFRENSWGGYGGKLLGVNDILGLGIFRNLEFY